MTDDQAFEYTVEDFVHDVGARLTDDEIFTLANNYPTYRTKNWRLTLLEGIRLGKTNYEILIDKLKAKEIDIEAGVKAGGHETMIPHKIRRAAFRLLYIQYRCEGKSRTQANKAIRLKHFPGVKADTIRKNTQGCLLDEISP